MTLQVIIIRADGALAETEDVRWRAFAKAFSESDYQWSCDREGFALTMKLGSSEARMAHYVRSLLRGRPETEDFTLLIQAMHRRASKIFSEMLADSRIEPRPGIRELVVTARAEGLRLVLVSTLARRDTEKLLETVLGQRGREAFHLVVADEARYSGDCERLYHDTRTQIDIDPRHCVVIEAGRIGREAAGAAGFPVITTRSAFCKETPAFGAGTVVVENLPDLISGPDRHRLDLLNSENRAALLSALQRLHAGNCEGLADLDWTDQMRVSDILKTKGSAVKTIEPNATLRALAHSFRKEAVGAMLVLDAEGKLQGIVSERDLARAIDDFGISLPEMRVADLMTRSVVTCAPEDRVAIVANVMTQRRIRHLPVVVNDAVVGLISIGDVLKHRLDEVQLEADVLRDVARARR
ncbi:CBS domain-containing protein [Hyphomicrobium denitrificans]|nr:CBS domain-containing protein [Hyphomicrobium denitrificans]